MFVTDAKHEFHPDVLVKFTDNEAVLVSLRDETIFSLNESGAAIARLIDSGASFSQIVETLDAQFEVDREELENSVETLIESLRQRGLIVESPQDSDS